MILPMQVAVFLRNPSPLKKKGISLLQNIKMREGPRNLVQIKASLNKPPSVADEVNTDMREGGRED